MKFKDIMNELENNSSEISPSFTDNSEFNKKLETYLERNLETKLNSLKRRPSITKITLSKYPNNASNNEQSGYIAYAQGKTDTVFTLTVLYNQKKNTMRVNVYGLNNQFAWESKVFNVSDID